jgi:hypothetical protein
MNVGFRHAARTWSDCLLSTTNLGAILPFCANELQLFGIQSAAFESPRDNAEATRQDQINAAKKSNNFFRCR